MVEEAATVAGRARDLLARWLDEHRLANDAANFRRGGHIVLSSTNALALMERFAAETAALAEPIATDFDAWLDGYLGLQAPGASDMRFGSDELRMAFEAGAIGAAMRSAIRDGVLAGAEALSKPIMAGGDVVMVPRADLEKALDHYWNPGATDADADPDDWYVTLSQCLAAAPAILSSEGEGEERERLAAGLDALADRASQPEWETTLRSVATAIREACAAPQPSPAATEAEKPAEASTALADTPMFLRPTYSEADRERAAKAVMQRTIYTPAGELVDAVAEALGLRRAGA